MVMDLASMKVNAAGIFFIKHMFCHITICVKSSAWYYKICMTMQVHVHTHNQSCLYVYVFHSNMFSSASIVIPVLLSFSAHRMIIKVYTHPITILWGSGAYIHTCIHIRYVNRWILHGDCLSKYVTLWSVATSDFKISSDFREDKINCTRSSIFLMS